jgi:hypothetical protein
MTSLSAGDTLYLRGGTYVENITGKNTRPATATAPILVKGYPGERPVIQGLLWLTSPSWWTLDGVNVTWNPANPSTSHMVKMINGRNWTLTNSELWGARSYANLLVVGTVVSEPANWTVSGNCIHDTYASNSTNQDQLIYANTGLTAGSGVIERNLLFNATNGNGVKLGGPNSAGGTANVAVRNNTIYNTSQSMLVSWQSNSNTISGNLLNKVGTNYANLRGYQLTGINNVATDNAGGGAEQLLLNDSGYLGVQNGAGNQFPIDPQFDSVSSCAGFHPSNPIAAAYGRYSGTTPAPDTTPPTTPAGLVTTATSNQVDLAWQSSTDNLGVTGYTVYRGGTKIATVGATTSYSDTTVSPSTTYSYAIDAVDAAGNHSPISSAVSVATPAAASPALFSDGFESGNLSQWTASTGIAVQQQEVSAGSWAARGTSTGSPAYVYKSLSTPVADLYYKGRVKIISQGASNVSFVRFRTSTGTPILSLMRRRDGKVLYYNEVTGKTTVGPSLSAGTWHDVQVHVLVNGTSSQIGVWVDGLQISTLTKTDSLGTTGVGRVYVGEPGSGKTFDFAFDSEVLSSSYISS